MQLGRVLIAVVVFAAASAQAADYVVQIGAFRNPASDFGELAAEYGTVSTSQSPSGLTRFQVGAFASESEARRALARLRAVGYADAFVLRKGNGNNFVSDLPAVGAAPPSQSPRGRSAVERLPADLRSQAVYLDGVLHIKDGDRFIPLDEYDGGRYR